MRTPFLIASILLASVLSCSKGGTDPVEEKPVPPAPVVEPEEPSLPVLCVDQPIVLSFESAPVLGTSGLVQVFKADGTLVDKINLADIASVDLQDNGIMLPKAAITADTPMNTFMDAVKGTSGRFRVVHYTPLRVKGKTLEIKLHGSSLVFGGSYYLTMDESVCGTAVAKFEFKVKAVPSGNTLKVNPDGSADFCTIQGAITHASTLGKDTAVPLKSRQGSIRNCFMPVTKTNLRLRALLPAAR